MGCFNMKCALTQLSIRPGDKVVVLFGVTPDSKERFSDYAGGFYYQPHYFKLITTPVYAEYDDYGWYENAEQDTLDAANAFLQAMGYGEAIDQGMLGEHGNDALSHLADVVSMVEDSKCPVNVGYTFIHRQAWNNLLVYGREKMTRVCQSLNLDATKGAVIAEMLSKAGASEVKFNNAYDPESGYLEGNIKRPQLFEMAISNLQAAIDSLSALELGEGFEKLTEEQQSIRLKYAKIAQAAECDQSVLAFYASSFQWLRPLFSKTGSVTPQEYRTERMSEMLKKVLETPGLYQQLMDTDTIFYALLANQLVVRASTDLPTQSQDSSYWGHIAITKAMGQLIYARAENTVPSTSNEGSTGIALIEEFAQRELKSPH